MRTSIEERPEPPRMDRRWCVFAFYDHGSDSALASYREMNRAAKTIGRLGLVPEIQVEGNEFALFATRRKKGGKRL